MFQKTERLISRGSITVDHVLTEYLRANKHETAFKCFLCFLLEFNPTDLYNAGFQKYLPRLELNGRPDIDRVQNFEPEPKTFDRAFFV